MSNHQRLSRHTSPELDPVVLLCTILTIAILAVTAWAALSRGPRIQCPAPDHPVYAAGIQQWICGDSLHIGVKAR